MSELGSRIKEAREELKELRDGGLQSNFNVTSLDQQLDRIEQRVDERGGDIPAMAERRLNNRLDKIESRIEEIRQRM
jgi:predicted ABC-type ATPase